MRHGQVRRGEAKRGEVRRGKVWRGEAKGRQGEAWRGVARHGKAKQGKGEAKARQVFSGKEKKILTTFSIEPTFKAELEDLFRDMGLGWAAGIRFALKEFYKKHNE